MKRRQSTLSFGPRNGNSNAAAVEVICLDDDDEQGTATPAPSKRPSASSAAAAAAAAGKAPASKQSSAFDVMMSTAATPSRREVFDWVQLSPISLEWSWAPAAAAAASECGEGRAWAWEGSIQMKLEGEAKPATVRLRSTLGSAAAANPGAAASAKPSLSPGLLKSALQKSVRRGLEYEAVVLTAELWRLSPVEVIRRLMIIIIEDVSLHPASPALAWLLLAVSSAGYLPSDPHLHCVLSLVRDICRCGWRDKLRAPHGSLPSKPIRAQDMDHLAGGAACTALLRSLVARAGYGGMGGDMRMLLHAQRVFFARFGGACSGGGVPSSSSSSASSSSQQEVVQQLHQPTLPWYEALCSMFGVSPTPCRYVFSLRPEHLLRSGNAAAASSSAMGAAAQPSSSASGVLGAGALDGPALPLSAIPRLRRRDVPLAAVDAHCSDLVEQVLASNSPALAAFRAALPASSGGAGANKQEVESALGRAMWDFRSSCNWRREVPLISSMDGAATAPAMDPLPESPHTPILGTATTGSRRPRGGDDAALWDAWQHVLPLVNSLAAALLRLRMGE